MSEVQKNRRDGGIELFRCLLMFGIVLHHCCVHGPFAREPAVAALFALTMPGVDGFVAISGWFGVRFCWRKWFRLLALVVGYACAVYAFRWVAHTYGFVAEQPSFVLGGMWFASAYLALMLFSSLINAGVEALAQNQRHLLMAWGLFALAMFLSWLPGGCRGLFSVSGWGSHTFSTLLFVYVTARVARLLRWDERFGRWAGLVCLVLSVGFAVGVALSAVIEWPRGGFSTCMRVVRVGYHAPFVWVIALAALLFFLRLRVWNWLGRVACFLGPSMFGIYLLHESRLQVYLYQRPEAWMSAHFPQLPSVLIVLAAALLCFTITLSVDLLRRALLAPLRPFFARVLRH